MNSTTKTDTPISKRLQLAMLSWLSPGAEAALAKFRQDAAPLWEKYDLRVERLLSCTGKGQLVGTNPHEAPQLLQILSFPSLAAFQEYAADPDYVRLAKERDAALERITVVLGNSRDVSALHPTSGSAPSQRLYGIAFVRFLPGGADGLDEFNRRAAGLFLRHGMHVEAMFDAMKTVTPLGEPLPEFAPERVITFFLDDPTALRAYAADPEYIELAPLRDRGLAVYDFFLGKMPA